MSTLMSPSSGILMQSKESNDVFQLIYSMSKDVAKESKDLYNKAMEETNASEEDIFPGFKAVSVKAHKMIALLKTCYENRNPSLAVQQQLLRDSTAGFAGAMLQFVQSRKDLFLNPFDFLRKQGMTNAHKNLLEANNSLASALDSMRQAMEEDEAEDDKEETKKTPDPPRPLSSSSPLFSTSTQRPVLNAVNSAIFSPPTNRAEPYRQRPINVFTDKDAVTLAANNVKDAVYKRDSDRFFKIVKDFVGSINRLFELVRILALEISEKTLKDSAVLLINSGRAVLNAPEDDDGCLAIFGEAVVKMDQVLQDFVYACGKSPAGRQSIRASVKLSQSINSPTLPASPVASPPHSYTSHTERARPLVKSASEEVITEDMNRASVDKKSKSNPNLGMRSTQITGRPPALSNASSPGFHAPTTVSHAASAPVFRAPATVSHAGLNAASRASSPASSHASSAPAFHAPTTASHAASSPAFHGSSSASNIPPPYTLSPAFSPALSPAYSPASNGYSPAHPMSGDPSDVQNWERAEAVRRTVSRPAINIAHTTPQSSLGSVPMQSANNAALLPPMAGLTRLVPSPSTPLQSSEREKGVKMARSASVNLPSPTLTATPREAEEYALYEIANTVAAIFCERYSSFAQEWKTHTPAQRESTLAKIAEVVAVALRRSAALPTPPPSALPTPTPPSLALSTSSLLSSPASLPTSPSPTSLPFSPPSQPSPAPPFALSPPPLSLSASPLPSKPKNKPEKPHKKDKHEKEKEKHEKEKEKHEKHKKDKGTVRAISHNISVNNLAAELGLIKSPLTTSGSEDSLAHLHELTRTITPGEWIISDTKKKRSKTIISRKKLTGVLGGEDSERSSPSPAGRHLGEFANGLETYMTDFLNLVNKSILSIEQNNCAVPRNSSISVASIESLATSINGMRDNLKEVLELHSKTLEAYEASIPNGDGGSDRKLSKKKDKSPPQVVEILHRLVNNAISSLDSMPIKGKSNDAMTSALQAVTVNFINTKLKMEDTLEENICTECANLRGCVTQIALELRNNSANVVAEDLPSQAIIFQLASSVNIFVDTMKKVLDSIATLRYVMLSESSFHGSIKINDGTSDDVNIWDDTTEILYTDGVFRAGNLNKLVETLTSTEQIDNKYLSTFITTYQSITTPAEFFGKLVQRYNIPASASVKDSKAIKVRVCIVLKYWIENQFRDFDQDMVAKLFRFIDEVLPKDGNGEVAKALSKQLNTKVNEVTARRNAMVIQSVVTLGLNHSPSQLFYVFSAFEIAKQLTLIEYSIFSKIHPAELLSQSWNSRTARQHSTHVLDLIQRTNRISFWVGSLLLWQPTLHMRIKILSKIIQLGQELRNLNNFNTLMGIVAGLSMSAVNRLKSTFKGLDSKQAEVLEKLQAVLNPGMSFKCYRQELSGSKGPCLPYLGTILSDLTFMEEGNPNLVQCPKTKKMLVNYSKRELINNVLLEIKLYQQVPYNIVRMDPLTSFLEALPCAEDKELYELSLLREPREQKSAK